MLNPYVGRSVGHFLLTEFVEPNSDPLSVCGESDYLTFEHDLDAVPDHCRSVRTLVLVSCAHAAPTLSTRMMTSPS